MGRGRVGVQGFVGPTAVCGCLCFSWAIFELDLNVSLLPKIHWKRIQCEKAHGYAKRDCVIIKAYKMLYLFYIAYFFIKQDINFSGHQTFFQALDELFLERDVL